MKLECQQGGGGLFFWRKHFHSFFGLRKSHDIPNHGTHPQQMLSNLVAQSVFLDLLD